MKTTVTSCLLVTVRQPECPERRRRRRTMRKRRRRRGRRSAMDWTHARLEKLKPEF